MFRNVLILILFLSTTSILMAQARIPDSIKSDLVLKPAGKPYESNGFTIEKGATLTLMAGVKIKLTVKAGEKANYPVININGGLKVSGGTKPSVEIEGKPVIIVNSGNLDISGLNAKVMTLRLFGNTTGSIKSSIFDADNQGNKNYNFEITVPKKDNMTIVDCLFQGRGLEIHTDDFPNDLNNLVISKCAFTTYLNPNNGKKLMQYFIPITLFAYGSKCDSYLDIEFKAFNWDLKKPLASEWYIDDETKRKTLEASAKENKMYALKLPSKAFTAYKQVEPAEDKDEKKDKK